MAIKVFADGANLEGMLDMYENGNVQGFTTNPSLMKQGGVTDCFVPLEIKLHGFVQPND